MRAPATAADRRHQAAVWHWRVAQLPSTAVLLEIAVITLAVATFLALGRLYAATPIVAIDEAGLGIARALHSAPLDTIMPGLTQLGSDALLFVWLPVVAVLIGLRRVRSASGLVVVALAVHVWNDALKGVYQRTRPAALEGVVGVQAFSFPSGHAMAAGAVYGMLALVAWRELRGPARWVAVGLCVVVALCVAFSRVYLGVHYPTDVLAGLLAGALWADLVALGWRAVAGTQSAFHRE